MLPKLISPEQFGFLAYRSTFDNILSIHKIAQSIETDRINPPRMLLKIDIEKVFDTIEWNCILVTLLIMGFPDLWISWIHSFSFLINGHPSKWIYSSRGVRQGDPISPLFFLLVTQNLLAILNHTLHINFFSGFDPELSLNFNHLMFVDDLILITKASRQSAKNILFCLNLYANFSGQHPN